MNHEQAASLYYDAQEQQAIHDFLQAIRTALKQYDYCDEVDRLDLDAKQDGTIIDVDWADSTTIYYTDGSEWELIMLWGGYDDCDGDSESICLWRNDCWSVDVADLFDPEIGIEYDNKPVIDAIADRIAEQVQERAKPFHACMDDLDNAINSHKEAQA